MASPFHSRATNLLEPRDIERNEWISRCLSCDISLSSFLARAIPIFIRFYRFARKWNEAAVTPVMKHSLATAQITDFHDARASFFCRRAVHCVQSISARGNNSSGPRAYRQFARGLSLRQLAGSPRVISKPLRAALYSLYEPRSRDLGSVRQISGGYLMAIGMTIRSVDARRSNGNNCPPVGVRW